MLRQEYQLLTRRRLLDAALEVFDRDGFHSATVEKIVAAAGVARATFYLHFKNKMEIVTALTDEIRPGVAELYRGLDEGIAVEGADVRAVVTTWLDEAIAWFDDPQNRIMTHVWQRLSVEPGSMVARGISVDDCMPRYLALWPPDVRESARTRVVLLSHLLARAYFLAQQHVLATDETVTLAALGDIWAAGLFPVSQQTPPTATAAATRAE